MSKQRRFADYRQAIALLKDPHLLWSEDMDAIRVELAKFLEQALALGWDHNESLHRVVLALIADENDLSVK